MRISSSLLIALAGCASAVCQAEPTVGESCVQDLRAIAPFLLENDTGAPAHLAQFGQKHFDDALAAAEPVAAAITDAGDCKQAIHTYLRAWRKGHLFVNDTPEQQSILAKLHGEPAPAAADLRRNDPALRVLSRRTLLLSLPSFGGSHRAPLVALLKRHHATFAGHPNWIIDVRGNGGGNDSSYEPLLAWLLADEVSDTNAAWLVTPANIDAQAGACAQIAPGDDECTKQMAAVAARMRTVAMGGYIAQTDLPHTQFERQTPLERQRPARVAILTDGGCASSCEEFLLIARQSYTVKLIGRRSFGSLDYSNLRPHLLPSGLRELWYATSRSYRLPDDPVDLAGIAPDIYLPRADADAGASEESCRVQRWLEGGTLAPGNTAACLRLLSGGPPQ